MKLSAKDYAIVTALAIFVGLPLLIYVLGDTPRRSVLKEALSVLTLLAFSLMLGQFFLARSNEAIQGLFKPRHIQKAHKVISYSATGVMLVHPFLIVLPRYFEAGITPWDAFVIMTTTFDNRGILLGLISWVFLLVLVMASMFRARLIKRLRITYATWRYIHGGIAAAFIALAIWHGIDLGRHTDTAMATYFITLAVIGVAMLFRQYWGAVQKKPTPTSELKGEQT